jgi:hypothetical protein
MEKRLFLSIFTVFLFLSGGMAQAFVPQPSHLLYLVINKIKQPVGIEVWQIRKILNYQGSEPDYFEPVDSEPVDPAPAYFEFEEKLIFSYPDKLRVQRISQTLESFSIESNFNFIKIVDGVITSHDKSLPDLYSDILLYRDHETLLNQLAHSGIDTAKVSMQRYNDTICYVLGAFSGKNDDFPGLWIEKDTFLPVKYVVEKNGKRVEFFYKNWQKVSKTLYPMQIHIFLDNRLFAMINVKNFHLRSGFLPVLFDLDDTQKIYPENNFVDEKKRREQSMMESDLKSVPEIQQINE